MKATLAIQTAAAPIAAALLVMSSLSSAARPDADSSIRADSVQITLIDHAEVSAQEAGMLAEIAVREGQLVKAGELLAQVDDSAAQIAKRRAKTELDIARKSDGNTVKVRYAKDSLATAKAEFQRATASIEKYRKSVTGSEIDQLRLAAEQATLEVEQAEHDLAVAKLNTELKQNEFDYARLNVERRRVLAPLDGMVVQIKRRRGEWVQAGESVVRVLRLDRLRAEGFVSAKEVGVSAVGRPVTLRVDLPGKPRAEFAGTLVFVSPEVNPVNGQVRIWAELDNKDLSLRPGVAAEMTIEPAAAAESKQATVSRKLSE
jgi:RND family efflux transporter MFP subunit